MFEELGAGHPWGLSVPQQWIRVCKVSWNVSWHIAHQVKSASGMMPSLDEKMLQACSSTRPALQSVASSDSPSRPASKWSQGGISTHLDLGARARLNHALHPRPDHLKGARGINDAGLAQHLRVVVLVHAGDLLHHLTHSTRQVTEPHTCRRREPSWASRVGELVR